MMGLLKRTTDSIRTAESLLFAKIFQAYKECSDEIQEGICEMVAIINDPESSEQENAMALHSLEEALFPTWIDSVLTLHTVVCSSSRPRRTR